MKESTHNLQILERLRITLSCFPIRRGQQEQRDIQQHEDSKEHEVDHEGADHVEEDDDAHEQEEECYIVTLDKL